MHGKQRPEVSTAQADKFFHLFEGPKALQPYFNQRKVTA